MFAFDSISLSGRRHGTVARSITYRGVSFDPDFNADSFIPWTTVQMIATKDYSYQVALYDVKKKYEIIVKIYMCDKDEMTQQYIKKRFRTIFMFFLQNFKMYNGFTPKYSELYFGLLAYLIQSGEFISKRNMETYIQAAKEKMSLKFWICS